MTWDQRRALNDSGSDGGGSGARDHAFSWDSKRVLRPLLVVPGYPGNLGVLPASNLV